MRVDVIVTDRQGNPVTDLKLEDFEIQEDGKPQKAETFRLVKIDTLTQPGYTQRTIRTRNDEETAAADENSRIFVFFLDDYHVRKETSMSVKTAGLEFIANQLAPSDLISVMYPLTPTDAVTLTRSHQGVINAVDRFVGRKYDYEPINDVERGYVYKLTPQAIEMIRRQVSLTAHARHLHEARLAARGPQVVDPGQRRLHLAAAAADAQQSARRASPRRRPDARSVRGREQPHGGSRAVLGRHGHAAGVAGRVRRLQSQQHVDLCARSARA